MRAAFLLAMLCACATGRPPPVFHAQLLAGASARGDAGIYEVRASDGETVGRALVLDAGSDRLRAVDSLSETEIQAILGGAAPPASPRFAALGIIPERLSEVPALPLNAEVPGAPPLALRIERLRPWSGPGADVVLASDGLGNTEIEVARFPVADEGGIDTLWRLPGGARVVATAKAQSGDAWRVRAVRIIDLGPAAASLHAMHGLADYYRRDWQAAEGEYQRAVRLDPANATAHYNLACVYALWDKPELALAALTRALELDPRKFAMYARIDKDFASMRERRDFRAMVKWKE